MKVYKIVYLDLEHNKKSTKINCYTLTSAKTSFKKMYKDRFVEILYVLPLGSVKSP